MRLPLSVLSTTLVLVLTIAACKKDKPHESVTSVTDTTIHINYIYLATSWQVQQDSVSQYELILTSGSTVVLDTIAAVNTPLSTDIKTPSALVDMTVIIYRPVASAYYITTEKAISPGAWSLLPGSDSVIGLPASNPIPNYTNAYVYYTHVPVASGQPYYFSGSNANIQMGTYNNPSNDQLTLLFGQYPGFDVYLSFPNQALYNFHHMSGSSADTVDLSTMDTAISLRIPRPSIYTETEVFVNGFTDTTNLAQNISVSANQPGVDTITGADLVYPGYKKVFQKYQLSYTAWDNAYADICSYSDFWADSINPTPILLDNTYFNLLSNTNNNFSVLFTKGSPGSYSMQYTGTQFYLTVNAPSDSVLLHPLSFLTALKGKMLQNVALSSMQPTDFSFGYEVIQGQLQPIVNAPITNLYANQRSTVPLTFFQKTF